MSWLGWLLAFLIAYVLLSDLLRSKRCYPHGVFGRCRRCEEEAAARAKAEAEARAEAERQRVEIEETYKNMDEAKRDELTTLVKERAKREDFFIGPGDLEAAVVRMYKRSQIKETKSASPPMQS
jgi:ferredoxin-NADP reductase